MIDLTAFIDRFELIFKSEITLRPWEVINDLERIVIKTMHGLPNEFILENGIAIHRSAVIEQGVTLKGPVIISENCFIGAHAYLRGPVYLDKSVKVGPGSEIKQSMIFENSALAHFNYAGNSIIGSDVNFEAGSIAANHFNERKNKEIFVKFNNETINTKTNKFGSLVGDNSKIGANAVLSPGTILKINSIVRRLELVDQSGTSD